MTKMSTIEFYDKVEELQKLEERDNEKYENRLTEWFGDYGMWVPKFGITEQEIVNKLEKLKKGV